MRMHVLELLEEIFTLKLPKVQATDLQGPSDLVHGRNGFIPFGFCSELIIIFEIV